MYVAPVPCVRVLIPQSRSGTFASATERRRVATAVDRSDIAAAVGPSPYEVPTERLLDPGATGISPADVAGQPSAGPVVLLYRNRRREPQVAQIVAMSLRGVGIDTQLRQLVPTGGWTRTPVSPRGVDLGVPVLCSYLDAGLPADLVGLFSREDFQAPDYSAELLDGGFFHPDVERLLGEAARAGTRTQARSLLAQAEDVALAEAAFVPLVRRQYVTFTGTRVRNWQYLPGGWQYDITQVWLNGGGSPVDSPREP